MVISFKDSQLERVCGDRADNDTSPSLVAKRDLERYYLLLNHAESELSFTSAEYSAIYDCCNGTMFEPAHLQPGVVFNVQDALLRQGFATKHGIDGDALVVKLRSLTPVQSWALVDKIERFWRQDSRTIFQSICETCGTTVLDANNKYCDACLYFRKHADACDSCGTRDLLDRVTVGVDRGKYFCKACQTNS